MAADPKVPLHLRPLKPADAKPLFREIMEKGVVSVSPHAAKAMEDDCLQTTDCLNLLRAGVVEVPELINDEWRYRISTAQICIVVTLVSPTRLRVVTAWRIQ